MPMLHPRYVGNDVAVGRVLPPFQHRLPRCGHQDGAHTPPWRCCAWFGCRHRQPKLPQNASVVPLHARQWQWSGGLRANTVAGCPAPVRARAAGRSLTTTTHVQRSCRSTVPSCARLQPRPQSGGDGGYNARQVGLRAGTSVAGPLNRSTSNLSRQTSTPLSPHSASERSRRRVRSATIRDTTVRVDITGRWSTVEVNADCCRTPVGHCTALLRHRELLTYINQTAGDGRQSYSRRPPCITQTMPSTPRT